LTKSKLNIYYKLEREANLSKKIGGKYMLKIECKIGPKKKGRHPVPLTFTMRTEGEEEKDLMPLFHFKKQYRFPYPVFGMYDDQNQCYEHCMFTTAEVNIEKVGPFSLNTQQILLGCKDLNKEKCKNCKVYLPWKPGQNPDYSDVLNILEQMAKDVTDMYNNAINEANESIELDEKTIFVYEAGEQNILVYETKNTETSKPSRRVKI